MAVGQLLLNGVNVDTSGVSQALPLSSHRTNSSNGQHFYGFYCYAVSFGGGVVRVEISVDGGAHWFTARSLNDNQLIFSISDYIYAPIKAELIRGTLTGSVGASGVTLRVF